MAETLLTLRDIKVQYGNHIVLQILLSISFRAKCLESLVRTAREKPRCYAASVCFCARQREKYFS